MGDDRHSAALLARENEALHRRVAELEAEVAGLGGEAAHSGEARFRAIVEHSTDAITLIDERGTVLYESSNVPAITGNPVKNRLGRSGFETVIPEDLPRVRAVFVQVVSGGPGSTGSLEFRVQRPDGTIWWAEGSATNLLHDSSVRAIVVNYRDISARKAIEAQLVQSRLLLEQTFEQCPVPMVLVSMPDAVIRVVNPAALEFLGMADEPSVVGRRLPDITVSFRDFDPQGREGFAGELPLARSLMGQRTSNEERRIVRKDGSERWELVSGTPIYGVQGEIIAGYLIMIDITDRKRAEHALQQQRWRLQSILEGTDVGTWEWNVQTGETVFNERWAEIIGYRLDELQPTTVGTWETHTHPEDLAHSDELLRRHFSGELPYYDCECRMRHKDGNWVWVLDRGRVITRAADGKPLLMFGTHLDITERKRFEAERERLREDLFQARKMEAIGTLAGGVAHDFNNILGGILGGLSLLELDLGPKAAHSSDIQAIKAMVERGAELTKQLLGFARRGKYDVKPLDLGRVVEKTSEMFGRTRKDIVIQLDLAPDLPPVLMDHTQLEQVLLNLFLNASQAMPRGGRLLVRAETATLGREEAGPHGAAAGRFVKLVVADTGSGMDAETLSHIFEPFFTTKGPGSGTGLGLASVYGIVRNHGGLIRVESEKGKGTTFTLFLPPTDLPVQSQEATAGALHQGSGTILLVDDEAQVSQVCGRMLERLGYEVIIASSGRQAIDLAREHQGHLRLVILDLVMPEMSGAATFDALQAIDPDLKVLLSSGYSLEGQAQELLARGCCGFIQKPFDAATLSARLKELL